jgi:hypothetical protein
VISGKVLGLGFWFTEIPFMLMTFAEAGPAVGSKRRNGVDLGNRFQKTVPPNNVEVLCPLRKSTMPVDMYSRVNSGPTFRNS